jgi:hypothetical protein
MNGLFFYWLAWLLWVLITFFMEKNITRTFLAFIVLAVITFSNTIVTLFGNIEFTLSIFVVYIFALVMVSQTNKKIITLWKSICLVFGYVGFLFWEQISPVWIVAPREILIPVFGFILLLLLNGNTKEKLAIWCLGTSTGEILHGVILHSYDMREAIGNMSFFDLLVIEISFLVIAHHIVELKKKLDIFVQSMEKQKKRWTS